MTTRKTSALVGLGAALLVSLLYLTDFFNMMEQRVYDSFLRFRPARERYSDVVFLDVDDQAIAHVGIFPWPRSVMADSLLRLKEYGVKNVIFDIEYIDKSPPGLDMVYLDRSLPGDFSESFGEINSGVSDLLQAFAGGQISPQEAAVYTREMSDLITHEQEALLQKVGGIARNNDEYLAQAARLFGQTWSTLNLQQDFLLTGEQADRRPLAQEKFAYPVAAVPEVSGEQYVDILAAIPPLIHAARGAGFTNIVIDDDGVRRRIYLARQVLGAWYLQLAFAPLMEYLGDPLIIYRKDKMILQNAELPNGTKKDIVIPLDSQGAMLLDWPTANYFDSYSHLSFATLSYLEEYQAQMERYLANLFYTDIWFYPDSGASLGSGYETLMNIRELLEEAAEAKRLSLEENSDSFFETYVSRRREAFALTGEFIAAAYEEKIPVLLDRLKTEYPDQAEILEEDEEYILTHLEYLGIVYDNIGEIEESLGELEGKFCILGRTDTGTTDIGVNPFWGEYINVGTHAVVLDTILSQSFITPLDSRWSALATLLLVPLLIILISRYKRVGLRYGLGLGSALLLVFASFALFYVKGIFFGPLGLFIALTIATLVREFITFMSSEQEKQFIRSAFSRYLAPEVINQLLLDPSKLNLGGEKREMTVLFTDIQGFSSISEKLDPAAVVNLLNIYLTEMSDIILENNGTIDKYEGDAIIAFFGAPVYVEKHAILACRTAVKMKRAERKLNTKIMEEKLSPTTLFTRLGINTGDMVVGNMGTTKKMDYTVMGNAVNLAARLEGVNKQYQTGGILISEYTRQKLGDEFILRHLDRVRVVGINTPLRLYEVLESRDEAGQELRDMAAIWNEAVEAYENREFEAAYTIFSTLLMQNSRDMTAKLYL
ncbi:MAG: adenylate/guanylate cyclase domain-containing protein, partial [Treponema sp.]|nr:adenylate/guanylate cyclase domain-containing protein [Treponema sp.]